MDAQDSRLEVKKGSINALIPSMTLYLRTVPPWPITAERYSIEWRFHTFDLTKMKVRIAIRVWKAAYRQWAGYERWFWLLSAAGFTAFVF